MGRFQFIFRRIHSDLMHLILRCLRKVIGRSLKALYLGNIKRSLHRVCLEVFFQVIRLNKKNKKRGHFLHHI